MLSTNSDLTNKKLPKIEGSYPETGHRSKPEFWPEITKLLKNKFLSYPTRPLTHPVSLEHVFMVKNARNTLKTGAKPSEFCPKHFQSLAQTRF